MSTTELEDLFKSFRDTGSVDALGAVFDAAAPELHRVAGHLCRSAEEAEDAVQTTFLTAIEKRKKWDASRPLLPWLLGILAIVAKKQRSRAARTPDVRRLEAREVEGPEREVVAGELRDLLEEGIAKLPESYGPAVAEHLLRGASASEVGKRFGISANAASVRLHRGIKLLRGLLPAGAALGGLAALQPAYAFETARVSVLEAGRAALGAKSSFALGGAGAWAIGAVLAVGGAGLAANALLDEPGAPQELAAQPGSLRGTGDGGRPGDAFAEGQPSPDLGEAAVAVRRPAAEVVTQDAALTPAQWLQRFMDAPDFRAAIKIGEQIAALPPAEGLAVMRAIYPSLPDVTVRQNVLKPFVFGGAHPEALGVLELAATDRSLEVQEWAFDYLKGIVLQDFSTDYVAYGRWRQRYRGGPIAEVIEASVREAVGNWQLLGDEAFGSQLDALRSPEPEHAERYGLDLGTCLREAGATGRLLTLVQSQATGGKALRAGFKWLGELGLERAELEASVVPLLDDPRTEAVVGAIEALSRPGAEWVLDPVLEHMASQADLRTSFTANMAVARVGSAAAIPRLIELLAADDSERVRYAIGYYGLAELTGVTWNASMDAAWWSEWWLNNRSRMPVELRTVDLQRATVGSR